MRGEIKKRIRYTVVNSNKRLVPIEVVKKVSYDMKVERKMVEVAIKELINEGILRYTYFGNSFLQVSMDRPVHISKRIIIKPPHKMFIPQKDDIVIDIKPGSAFGDGGHPSTYLVLKTLDNLTSDPDYFNILPFKNALDVGTGSGILAIAAAKLGIKEVLGIDINRAALFEAEENVRINNLSSYVTISDIPLEEINSCFSLIMANIGSNTLNMLCPLLVERIEEKGFLIISGFTTYECESLLKKYLKHNLILEYRVEEHHWVCLTFSKPLL
ncbi:MAG: 50S ribosomal protein L11 methyltransferase [Nitrospirae bacterium]|nr:50S ribosomal protein L11 methyltransferase [Nitrospirota bacterium]